MLFISQNIDHCPYFSYMINNWNGVDTEKATQYVLDSLSYEGKLLRHHQELRNNFLGTCTLYTLSRSSVLATDERVHRLASINLIAYIQS